MKKYLSVIMLLCLICTSAAGCSEKTTSVNSGSMSSMGIDVNLTVMK